MDDKERNNNEIIDEDLYEEFDDEELYELVEAERQKVLQKEKNKKDNTPKRPFPKWAFWLIVFAMFLNIFALFPQFFSIPAIEFLKTSAILSTSETVQQQKKAVVVIETENSKGTGFAISADGTLLTNYHVIEDKHAITVAFPDNGLFQAEVIESYPTIDLAVIKVDGKDLPYLSLAEQLDYESEDAISFIGNPLKFNGIANEGNIIGYTKLSSWDEEVLMIEAPVYRGNSGSPILNQDGEVIGVIFATLNHETHGRVGLFVPINLYYQYRSE
ncbi:S1C family serine protease [Oceanobacillus chungangensis]|uniref:Serine protease n=1 Tax=Oceanobacillus chungangensis TaxID=1229152 RepID=A0A3D8PUR4_9BACI|nr:serine protease [Oceanobacillus chungangensis]RDW19853.1 serine protease [Oceanobacillus chungangensis]